jgi:two-component system response regulator MprA
MARRVEVLPMNERRRRHVLDSPQAPRTNAIAADHARAMKQILIVEDDAGSRRALTNVLQDRGYTVAAVETVSDALDRLDQHPLPQLIVLDMMLPDMEGWDFRHKQKNDPRIAGIPVIGVSAVGKLVDVEYSFRKPLDYDQFLAAVEQYVGRPKA